MRLQNKIIIVLLSVCLFSIIITGIFVSIITTRNLEEQVVKHLKSISAIQKNRIDYMLDGAFERASVISDMDILDRNISAYLSSRTYSNFENLDNLVKLIKSSNIGFEELLLVDLKGRIIISSDGKENRRMDPDEARSFALGLSSKNIDVTDYNENNKADLLNVLFSGLIRYKSERIAVLVIKIDMDNMLESLKDYAGLGRTGEALIAMRNAKGDSKYISYLRFENEIKYAERTVPKTSLNVPVTQSLMKNSMVYSNAEDYRGKAVLASTEYIPRMDWGLVVKIDRNEALGDVKRVQFLIAIIILVISVLVVILAIYLSRSLTKPISVLIRATNEITSGKITQKLQVNSKDEIQALADTFNKMVENLDEINTKLAQSKRLSDIGTMASVVAHELRNPLATIKLALYNIEKKAGSEQIKKHIDSVNKKVDESDEIINNLLFFSKMKSSKFEKADIYGLINEIVENDRQIHGSSNVEITCNYEPLKGLVIEIDPLQITRLLSNVLNNAYESFDNGGKVEIIASVSGSNILIIIKDNGSGISDEDLKNIFEPFFTTKSKGTGLGLAVCQQIVSLHHGKIVIESKKGQGTTVTITLPITQPNSSN